MNCARDLGDQRLEADVPAIFLRVERAVPRHDPADVAGAVASQQEAGGRFGRRLQRLLDGRHGADDRRAFGGSSVPSNAGDLAARPAVEVGKGGAAFGGQRQFGDAAVGLSTACARRSGAAAGPARCG